MPRLATKTPSLFRLAAPAQLNVLLAIVASKARSKLGVTNTTHGNT